VPASEYRDFATHCNAVCNAMQSRAPSKFPTQYRIVLNFLVLVQYQIYRGSNCFDISNFLVLSLSTAQHHHYHYPTDADAPLAADTSLSPLPSRSEVLTKESGTYRRNLYTFYKMEGGEVLSVWRHADEEEEEVAVLVVAALAVAAWLQQRRRSRPARRRYRPLYEYVPSSFSLELMPPGRARFWLRFTPEQIR
jgi:hypothetical protein